MIIKRPLLLMLVMLAAAPISNSYADDLFYVELGAAENESDAAAQWKELAQKHPKLLKGLDYAPRAVIHAGRKQLIHIQAGPIEEKKDASRLCNRLFKVNVSCFIVEGLTPEYAKAPKAAPMSTPLPWLSAPDVIAAPQVKEESGFFSDVFGSDKKSEQPATEAKIRVAEAIRVPLTTNEAMQSTRVISNQPIETSTPGWLMIDTFESEANATDFWKKLRAAAASTVVGLRVLVIRPEMQEDKVSLSIGSFNNETSANDFCEQVVKPMGEALNCHFTSQAPKATPPAAVKRSSGNEEGAAEEPSRRELQRAARLHAAPMKLYWVQVASDENRREAEKAWNIMLARNADILEGLRHGITVEDSSYIVRVGPLSTEEEASELCQTLKERRLECRVESGL